MEPKREGVEEQKTTTHEFADIETCFGGNDYTNMAATYDGVSGNTTLLYSSTPVASFATPLKVIHASACSTTAPTLSVEMDTTMSKLAVAGIDVGPTLTSLVSLNLTSQADGVPRCTLEQTGMTAPTSAGRDQVSIGYTFSPGACMAKMLATTSCSKVAKQISLNSGTGRCYCATSDSGFTDFIANSAFNIWRSPATGSTLDDGRCL